MNPMKAAMYNSLWHRTMPYIGLPGMCVPSFAASFANVYYAVALWSLPIAANRLKDGYECLELRRFAIAPDAPKNTASFMLSRMRKAIKGDMPEIKRLISYQDTGAHQGTIYKAAGWLATCKSEYVSWEHHSKRPGSMEQSTADKVRWECAI
jgi:hypothetical protein